MAYHQEATGLDLRAAGRSRPGLFSRAWNLGVELGCSTAFRVELRLAMYDAKEEESETDIPFCVS